MKKLGLVSLAAAVALSTSAFASELKIGADAELKGYSVNAYSKEADEYYNLEVNLGLVAKNDDGVTLKASWIVYDNRFGADGQYANNQILTDAVQPSLDYGYVIIPMGAATVKAGYVEAGPFGTDLTNSGNSTFKVAVDYKVNDMLSVGFEDHQYQESYSYNKDGGMFGAAGQGEKTGTRLYAKANYEGFNLGARVTQKNNYTGASDVDSTSIEAYALGNVANFNVAAHFVAGSNDAKGIYVHGLTNIDKLTTGLAYVMLTDGQSSSSEFDPTYLVDLVYDKLPSAAGDTGVAVVPVIYPINDMLTAEAKLATGKVVDQSYTEIDAGLTIALGKQTSAKLMYATASGDLTKQVVGGAYGDNTDDGVNMMGFKITTAF
jgi:hypothetical protein